MKTLYEKWSTTKIGGSAMGKTNNVDIDGNAVEVDFFQFGSKRNPHTINFKVNKTTDQTYNKHISAKTGLKILNHVHKRIDSYVRHVKPKHIEMEAVEPVRGVLYHQLAHKLAKKYNGQVTSTFRSGETEDGLSRNSSYKPEQRWVKGENKSVNHTVKFNWDKK